MLFLSRLVLICHFYSLKKYESTHQTFWNHFVKLIGDSILDTFIVTDCEDSIRSVLKIATKNYKERDIRCWKHLNKAFEAWVKKHKGTEYDVAFYVSGMRELLLQETQSNFESELKFKKEGNSDIHAWSEPFTNYFKKNIMFDIENLAKFAVLPIVGDHFNSFTGITTNHAEGLNSLVKTILEHKQRPLDVVNLAMLQKSFFCNEIKLGFANKDNWKLDPVYSKYRMESQYILTRNVTNPKNLVKELREHPESFFKASGCLEALVDSDDSDGTSFVSLNASSGELLSDSSSQSSDIENEIADKSNSSSTLVGNDGIVGNETEHDVDYNLDIEQSQPTIPVSISSSQTTLSSSQPAHPLGIYTVHDSKVNRAFDLIKN